MPPFDFVYACEVHSGLTGWLLIEGNPENFQIEKPVVYIQNEDPAFIQKAVFIRDAGDVVNMSMNDAPRFIGLDMAYMKILYTRPTYGEYPDA